MPLVIPVAHDFSCPWCWIALSQAKRLEAEFDVTVEWRGFELFPEELDWPESSGAEEPKNPDKPATPSRFALALAAEGLPKLTARRPSYMRTFRAHHALEFARDAGVFAAFLERLYQAHYLQGLNINELDTLQLLSAGLISDWPAMREAIEAKRYADRLVGFDDDAYAAGVYNVPTFWIGGERYAEQPYSVLRAAVAEVVGNPEAASVYGGLVLGPATGARPFVFMNMVSTIDGKIITGERNEPVMDLGSKTDHATMRHLERSADAVLIGAGSLRSTPGLWYDARLLRVVVTESGSLDFGSRFFVDAPERAVVVSPSRPEDLPEKSSWIRLEAWPKVLERLHAEFGVDRLLCEGGSELNASLLTEDLVDELFLTVAPKIKLGRDVPTIAGGTPFTREQVQTWTLVSEIRRDSELFLRYRRAAS